MPDALGPLLRQLIQEHGHEFEALLIPFKHYFCGQWIRHSGWSPGYTRAQLLKKGCFQYNERLHSGVRVEGRTVLFPADNPDLAIVHLSYDNLHHYLEKLNRYTDAEAGYLRAEGGSHAWQAQLAHFVHDLQVYYEHGRGDRDGMHGFVLAFMAGVYRFVSRAKLWDLRRQWGELAGPEPVPASTQEMLAFMAQVARDGAGRWLDPGQHVPKPDERRVPAAWYSPSPGQCAPPPAQEAVAAGASRRPAAPKRPGIAACIVARNEERQIEAALRSLQGWTDRIIVVDNESGDRTAEIARRFADVILTAPRAANFEAARASVAGAIEAAAFVDCDWLFCLDADERVSPALARTLRRLVDERGDQFEGLSVPFKNLFYGQWMKSGVWWPGRAGPRLLKKGAFRYGERIHAGVLVEGRLLSLPAADPDCVIEHLACEDISHYLGKLNSYAGAEAEILEAEGASHSWQAMLAGFARDWHIHYDQGGAGVDGMAGFVQSFLCAFYSFTSRAKLRDLRLGSGDGRLNTEARLNTERGSRVLAAERTCTLPSGGTRGAGPRGRHGGALETRAAEAVPSSLGEMIEFMARVARGEADQGHGLPNPVAASPPQNDFLSPSTPPCLRVQPERLLPLLWHAPLLDASGYADEARQFVLSLIEAGEPIALAPARWSETQAGLAPEVRARLEERFAPVDAPAELFVCHSLPALQRRSPQARINIARTMFETDRLPEGAAAALAAMDRVWVPSGFNRDTFARGGVDPEKIAVIPGAIDAAPFAAPVEPWPLPGRERYRFLSVFDWTLHKGWDVLLEAFAREFGPAEPDAGNRDCRGAGAEGSVGLILKVWSSNGYSLEEIKRQADLWLERRVGWGLAAFPNIHFWQELIPVRELPRLYRAVDAFVLPTRGEGWCRPLMEAMAAGLPTVATAWSGLTAFHDAGVGYPLECHVAPVSPEGAREIPLYAGHCWAEPDGAGLQRLMRRLVDEPDAGREKGRAAQQAIAAQYSRGAVATLLREEIARCRSLGRRGAPMATASVPPPGPAAGRQVPVVFRPAAHPLGREPAAPVDFQAVLGRPLRVRWEGPLSIRSSLALVNREFCLGLLASGDVELSVTEQPSPWHGLSERDDPRFGPLWACRGAALSGPPDVTVRRQFPPNWQPLPVRVDQAGGARLVVIQPWELSHLLEEEWVEGASRHADEVWAYSRFVRDVYVRSGVPAERLRVVPLGFNPALFTPEGPRYPLPTAKSVRFLFVGGTIDRKGADLLLEAYCRAFSSSDDVCLIVKDMGTGTFYRGQTLGDAFRRAQADPSMPKVIYLDGDLSDAELASLYRASTCVVLPYRGEGFGLPPLEGMACGRPSIVTAGGATDDFLDDTMALRLPHTRRLRPGLYAGPGACRVDPWQLEPDPDALVAALRWVRDNPEEARRRGEAARAYVAAAWTWECAVAEARARLRHLVAPPAEPPIIPAKPWAEAATHCEKASRSKGKSRNRSVDPTPTLTPTCSPVEISLCMIVRDEEPRLAQCLRSIAPYVDEIVVVDTGSTDRTCEVARRCGARVFEFPWADSFAAARNQSVDQARGAWIFWMDADDVISPESARELRRLVRQHPHRDVAFQAQVRIPPGPGEFSESVVDHVKLFPNRPDLRFEHRIHEQILPALRRAGLPVLFSDVWVTHQNYDRSEAGQARKRSRDLRLLELDLRDRPDHPFVLFNLGMTHLYATKEYEVAAHHLRRSLEASDWRDSIVRKAHAMLTAARMAQGEWEAALAANEAGRRHYPDDAELLFQAGQIYQQFSRLDEARRALERLVDGQEDPHYRSVDAGLRTYRGWHELALLFSRLGDGPHAERVLREIAAAHPAYLPAQLDLVEALHRAGHGNEARAVLARVPRAAGLEADRQRLQILLGTNSRSDQSSPAGRVTGEPSWDQAPAFGRRETLLRALRRLRELCPGRPCIVETGTLRDDAPRACGGDGWSTVAWGWFCAQTGGRAYTVDVDPRNLEICRRVTAPYAGAIEYVAADSVQFLRQWDRARRGAIDLLYLDSLDYFDYQREESEEHHRAEAEAALPALASGGLVLIDDTSATLPGERGRPPGFTGKGARAVPFLLAHGFRVEWAAAGQVLLARGGE